MTERTPTEVNAFLADMGRLSTLVEWSVRTEHVVGVLKTAAEKATTPKQLQAVSESWKRLCEGLKQLTNRSDDVHYPGFVEHACATCWDAMTAAQLRIGCGIGPAYRAMAAYVLAMLAFHQRDRGAALRWASLGYISDLLGNGGKRADGWGTYVTLRYGLGVPPEIIKLLDRVSKPSKGGAPAVEGLPEWRLTGAVAEAKGLALVAPSIRYSHHASTPFVKAAVEHALADAGDANKKGKRLERLAAFLTTTIPGMRPRFRLKSTAQSAEHDVVASTVGDSPYPLPERASDWLIECKNSTGPVTAPAVAHFLAKMQRAGSTFGILFAKKGTTGKNDRKYAEAFRREFCLKHRIYCLVVDTEDLRSLGAGGTFRGLIDTKYEAERFGASLFGSAS